MAIPGTALADGANGDETGANYYDQDENNLDLTVETVELDGKTVVLSVCEDTETGEEAAFVSEIETSEAGVQSTQDKLKGELTPPAEPTVGVQTAEADDASLLQRSDPQKVKEVIRKLNGDDIGTLDHAPGGWEGVIEDLPTEAEDYIVRAEWYMNDLEEDCEADFWEAPTHWQFGIGVEWTDLMDDLISNVVFGTILGLLVGAGLGAAAGAITGPGAVVAAKAGGAIGAVTGSVVSVVWDNAKNSKYLTFGYRDTDFCAGAWRFEACVPGMQSFGNGHYLDESEDIGSFGKHPGHLRDQETIVSAVGETALPGFPINTTRELIEWFIDNSDDLDISIPNPFAL
jgi:hypothetical protein